MHWKTRHATHDLQTRGMIMGILNVTPDSFSDGGRHVGIEAALQQARRMIEAGADIIDVGGESTRPGAVAVEEGEEIARTRPVIAALRAQWEGLISIDTMKPAVAEAALEVGADIVNDVTGLADPRMVGICASSGCGVVAMHMKGTPQTMQEAPSYDDVVAEVRAHFVDLLERLITAGVEADTIVFDPGIGFGKSLEHNLALLRALDSLQVADRPLLIGLSRKSFIGRLLASEAMEDRDWPTVALTAWTRESGVRIHRVHDVRPNREALRMTEAILHGV
ncbi:MAG: dihydropteroate synthase [Verrucomicrobiales bacterium]